MAESEATAGKKRVIVTAGPPVYGGLTIARTPQAKVLFIKGAIPGEVVEVSITGEKKDYLSGTVTGVIEPSPDRIQPAFKPGGPCIGCHLEYIAYKRQVSLKEEVLQDALRRIGGIETELAQPLALEDAAWNYRYRAQFKVAGGKIGFHKEKTKEVVDVDYSPLMIERINKSLKQVRDALHKRPKAFKGVTDIHMASDDGLFIIVKTDPGISVPERHWNDLAHILLGYELNGVWIETGAGKSKQILKYGEEFLVLPLDDINYSVSPNGFFQSNWRLNQVLVGSIKDNLQPLSGKRVLDLYAGAGNFALPISRNAADVIAVEENPSATEDGRRNVEINKIDNVEFIRSASEEFDISGHGHFDIVLLDPPRGGLSGRLIENLLNVRPDRIVYVSCNPSTFARDLKRLTPWYQIESVRLVDFFPQTYHIEAVAFLSHSFLGVAV